MEFVYLRSSISRLQKSSRSTQSSKSIDLRVRFKFLSFPTVTYLATLSGDPVEAAIHAVWTLRFDDSRVDAPTYKNFRFARYTAARYIKAKYVGNQAFAETEAPEWIRLFRVDVIFWMFYSYTVCILYFTVEAFVRIRSLPKGSYMLPQWSQLMPHI
jgi:hypothetical protein